MSSRKQVQEQQILILRKPAMMKDRDSCKLAIQSRYYLESKRDLVMLLGDDGKEDIMFPSFADKPFKLLIYCFKQSASRLLWILTCGSCDLHWHTFLLETLTKGIN